MVSALTKDFIPVLTASCTNTHVSSYFSLNYITSHDIKRVIDHHSHMASLGSDGISTTMLDNSPLSVLSTLAIIFSKLVMPCIFPKGRDF